MSTFPPVYDFDPAAPSPLEALRRLRADARDAVVAVGAQTAAQSAAYIPSEVDASITRLACDDDRPHVIFITGSAGGGKSGAAEYQRQVNPGLFSDIVEDATHADGPSRDQADTLAQRLAPLSDAETERPSRPILVAANIGMILQLASAWADRGHRYEALVGQLYACLGLPGAPLVPEGIEPLSIAVLNLDDRPTAGEKGLLRGMLPMLAPAPGGKLFDSGRCEGCAAIAFCPARANAAILATVAAPHVDSLADGAAIDRGRRDTPRALWDYLSRVMLPDDHYGQSGDPCLASQHAYRNGDTAWVLTGLLPLTAFRASGDLGGRIALLDPARAPTRDAYEAFAQAGLIPGDDARPLRRLLDVVKRGGHDAPALETAASALAAGYTDKHSDGEHAWRIAAARANLGVRILTGDLTAEGTDEQQPFIRALSIYERWQAAEVRGAVSDQLLDEMEEHLGQLVRDLGQGLSRMFGEVLEGRTFLPVQNYDPREASRAYVEFELSTATALPALDRPTQANPLGAAMVGYRPLAILLQLEAGQPLEIDLPTYRLLKAACRGLAGGSGDAERTFALSRAAESLARAAAEAENVAMLVTDPETGRRYQVTTQLGIGDRVNLRARAVSE